MRDVWLWHHRSATSNETQPTAYLWLAHAATPGRLMEPILEVPLCDAGAMHLLHVLLCSSYRLKIKCP